MFDIKKISKDFPVIAWWSGGVTSAITCWLCILWFGVENVRVVFQDTKNEDPSTYEFLKQCEIWYGCKIETISNPEYNEIMDVWVKYLSLNVATGAICSTELKRVVREQFQSENNFSYQAFGFDIEEIDRAKAMKYAYPESRPIFPLIYELLTKRQCIEIIQKEHNLFHPLTIPTTYRLGYENNNCWQRGCVQGGIGYWQKIEREDYKKFFVMAMVEHHLTNLKGKPVTMLKDQSKKGGLVFLMPHEKYPKIKDISMMKGRPVKPLMECNGFCGTNDMRPTPTEKEINYSLTN